MVHSETAVLLSTVLDELCMELSLVDVDTRTHVASRLLEATEHGTCSLDHLMEVGREALHKTPTMWP